MKKAVCILLAALMLITAVGCGAESSQSTAEPSGPADLLKAKTNSAAPSKTEKKTDVIDIDLTKLSSTMVYSEVYNMLSKPGDYIGKTVKMTGNFNMYHDEASDKYYFSCLIADATACCSKGFEFVLEGEHTYPDDYPEVGAQITVTGSFDTYKEGETTYCQLINAKMSK